MTTPIHTLYENKEILVINKPSGMVVHPFDGSDEKTLLDHLKESHPDIFHITGNTFRLQNGTTINLGGIVHKLDRETSGVMVIAKDQETYNNLQQSFLEHTIKKVYLALVEGSITVEALRINAPLGRNKKSYKQVAFPENLRGELHEAITDVSVVIRAKDITLVKLEPLTGRTHQLRAHMNHIGHPIVGDVAYGAKNKSSRIMLHAQSIRFVLDNKEHLYEAPTPELFITPFE